MGRSESRPRERAGWCSAGPHLERRRVQRTIRHCHRGRDHKPATESWLSIDLGTRRKGPAEAVLGQDQPDSYTLRGPHREEARPRFARGTRAGHRGVERDRRSLTSGSSGPRFAPPLSQASCRRRVRHETKAMGPPRHRDRALAVAWFALNRPGRFGLAVFGVTTYNSIPWPGVTFGFDQTARVGALKRLTSSVRPTSSGSSSSILRRSSYRRVGAALCEFRGTAPSGGLGRTRSKNARRIAALQPASGGWNRVAIHVHSTC